MKTLSKRTRILLAIVAAVIVLIAAVVIFVQPELTGINLSGAAVILISPQNSTVQVGKSITLTASASSCAWSNPDGHLAFVNGVTAGKTVTVRGAWVAKAQVIASCTGGGVGAATVQVLPVPSPTPKPPLTIKEIEHIVDMSDITQYIYVTLRAENATAACEWTSGGEEYTYHVDNITLKIGMNRFHAPKDVRVSVQCGTETASTTVAFRQ